MLRRPISYTDFDDKPQTDVYYFHLSKPELVSLEVEREGGLIAFITKVAETRDAKVLIEEFKRILLLSVGERSDDNKRFIKNDRIREEFEQSAAFEALYMELLSDDNAAVEFLKGVIPNDLAEQAETMDRPKIVVPPPPPASGPGVEVR